MRQVDLDYRGKRISASLKQGQTTSGEAPPGAEPPMWYVTIGSTALTKLAAQPTETDQSVRSRIQAWLEAHPDLLDRDQIVLGGG